MILNNSTAEAGGPICTTINGQKAPTGYHTDLVGGVMLINGAHDNTIESSTFNGTSTTAGYSIGDGGNGFYVDPCANQVQPFSPAAAPMGPNSVFWAEQRVLEHLLRHHGRTRAPNVDLHVIAPGRCPRPPLRSWAASYASTATAARR